MNVKVAERLSFGDETTCTNLSDTSVAIVHACKTPCHQRAIGYHGSLHSTHPHYLAFENGKHLFLNLIDPAQPLFMMPSFQAFLRFVDREIQERDVHIHCNRGESRAPSLALLYLAKRLHVIPDESYASASASFCQQFPYRPGQGIKTWLTKHWEAIV